MTVCADGMIWNDVYALTQISGCKEGVFGHALPDTIGGLDAGTVIRPKASTNGRDAIVQKKPPKRKPQGQKKS
jgi:hypothetical protein